MKRVFTTGIAIALSLLGLNGSAQETEEKKDKPSFRLGTFYTSRLHFYGRTDSLRSSGFFPMAEFWANKNIYINAAPVFILNNMTGFEYTGTIATAGLRLAKYNEYNVNIYIVKPLYKDNSQLVQSALKWQGAASYSWLNKVLNITAGADIKISDRTDYGLTAGIDHIFRKELGDGFILVLDPSASVNAGTQQFTQTSYKRNGFLIFPGVQQEVTEEVKNFSILSYELSIPVILARNKFQLIANPAYVVPQNLVIVENRPDLSERGKQMFYVTAGMKFNF